MKTDPHGLTPYTLRAPHQHGGVTHPAGTVLELYPDQIERVRAAEDAVAAAGPGGSATTVAAGEADHG